jgi:glycosyltransferase involved in cell wall biosynthesis
MKVSVSIITYNHEPFIAQAIESALAQEVEFDYEILIGEDQSSDRTREIVCDYAARRPDRIRLLLHNHPKDHVRLNGNRNFVNNILNARGQYIALLDGDDYWTDPLKLQKQATFLDLHKECCACFHNVRVLHEGAPEHDRIFHPAPLEKSSFGLSDIVSTHFIPTCSTMFRNGLRSSFPDWFYQLSMGDWPLHVLNAEHGLYGYIDEVMAAYRVHSAGLWSGSNQVKMFQSTIEAAKIIKAYLGDRNSLEIAESIESWEHALEQALLRRDLQAGHVVAACSRFVRTAMKRPSRKYFRKGLRRIAKHVFRLGSRAVDSR